MPFYLGEKQIAGLGLDQTNYVVKETSYTDVTQLTQAFPAGNEFAYMVGSSYNTSIFIWNDTANVWQDVGIYGPYGETHTGPRGFRGYGVSLKEVVSKDPNNYDELTLQKQQDPDPAYYNVITFKEAARQGAETQRIANETARKSAETTRATQESSRGSTEAARVLAETGRSTAETTRVSAENTRIASETARGAAETTRNANETTRQTNETTRQSNETTRQTNIQTVNAFLAGRIPVQEWSSSQAYVKYNRVLYTSGLYECIQNAPAGTLPTNTAYFAFIFQQIEGGGATVNYINATIATSSWIENFGVYYVDILIPITVNTTDIIWISIDSTSQPMSTFLYNMCNIKHSFTDQTLRLSGTAKPPQSITLTITVLGVSNGTEHVWP